MTIKDINKNITLNLLVTTLFTVFAYWLLAVKNGFMLRWYDEMSLFEPTRFFFRQFLFYPGGMLRYAGAWLTQFMYYPWIGSTILISLWLFLAWLTRKAFRLSESAAPLSLIVPIALLVSVVQLDEAWLSMKSAGYIYSNTLGFIFTVGTLLIHRLASSRNALPMAISALAAICYFFAGYYALLAAALCAIAEIRIGLLEKGYIHYITAALTIALIFIIPPFYYIYLPGNTADNDYLYLKGLPELMMEGFDTYLWMPFIIATAMPLLLAVVADTKCIIANAIVKWASVAAVCCGAAWGVTAGNKSEQLRATVLMLQRLDRNDWAGMTRIMARIKEPPNYTMMMLNNLALVCTGHQGEDLSAYTLEKSDGRHSEQFTMTAFVQVPVYYNIGRFNQSYRWAMEHTVQYGKRVFFLKYMVKDALMKGETALAKRYNDILLSTMFHRKWAENMNRYIENPSLISEAPEFQNVIEIANQGEHHTM